VYLTAKASSKTAFEELAELDRNRQEVKENLEDLKNKLDEAKKAGDATKEKELEAQVEKQNEALKKLEKDIADKKQKALQ